MIGKESSTAMKTLIKLVFVVIVVLIVVFDLVAAVS